MGYVGLPLATLFAEKYQVIGYDINLQRIIDLNNGIDKTLEVDSNKLKSVLLNDTPKDCAGLFCSCNSNDIKSSNFYIITVPTPIDKYNRPDLSTTVHPILIIL